MFTGSAPFLFTAVTASGDKFKYQLCNFIHSEVRKVLATKRPKQRLGKEKVKNISVRDITVESSR
jgi:hypothetical protein